MALLHAYVTIIFANLASFSSLFLSKQVADLPQERACIRQP